MASVSRKTKRDRQGEALKQLEHGINSVLESEKWREFLDVQAKFHSYSFANCMLIMCQCPRASRVAGYKTWQSLGRQVSKGERAIYIFAPRWGKDEVEDEKTGETVKHEYMYFVTVPVFDISQTAGDELPTPVIELQGDDGGLVAALLKVAESKGLPVRFDEIQGTAKGYCDFTGDVPAITVGTGQSPAASAGVLVHELAHALMHSGDEYRKHAQDMELEAESVAYVVLQHFGIDSSCQSFGYLATWARTQDKASSAMRELGQRIQATAAQLIDAIEDTAQGAGDEVVAPELVAVAA